MGKRSAPRPLRDHPLLHQAGVLAWRPGPARNLEVLLIRRRHKRRWGIPKGIIESGQTAADAARQEAHEEAGINGRLSREPIGEFDYEKWGRICRVQVFLMEVTREHEHYDDEGVRERRWFPLSQAVQRKTRKGIRPLLLKLVARAEPAR
jgi:8-oxo-dGTP pyrophosphatase MutT (NUDIX family)